jgi:hypothetical protein
VDPNLLAQTIIAVCPLLLAALRVYSISRRKRSDRRAVDGS